MDKLPPISLVVALVGIAVSLLHSVWAALNIVECVAGHVLTGGVETMALVDGKVLIVSMWMVCL